MNNKVFPAHINTSSGIKLVQSVLEHSENVANYSCDNLRDLGMPNMAYIAGFFHDIGKYTDGFREYIEKASKGEPVVRGSVNHTFAGVRYLINKYHSSGDMYLKIAIELIAYAVGSHHGLFDVIDENGKHGIEHRLCKDGIAYEEAIDNAQKCISVRITSDIKERIDKLAGEMHSKITLINDLINSGSHREEALFYVSLLVRMLLSALIDADRRDTAEFMENKFNLVEEDNSFWKENVKFFEEKLQKTFVNNKSPINKSRSVLSDLCKDAAANPSGIYRLNIPTGAGKTLDSLRYALHHAKIYGKKRIIYVMPLLAIIEQNAAIIRDFVKDGNAVLEHHSNVVMDTDEDCQERYSLLIENWNSPIVITTLVQFLNTLFSGKTSSIRRMHSLANSIIIFDEVQTVPNRMLTLFNLACNFLDKVCNTTLLLCSATQPSLNKVKHPIHNGVKDLLQINPSILEPFNRVKLVNAGAMGYAEIVEFINEKIAAVDSLLVVCNTKKEAQQIFKDIGSDNQNNVFHISAGLCKEHRIDVLRDINKALKKVGDSGKKVICISTQVVEAGVDISFACVIRLQAGMDSIVQSAGRCNRHGEQNKLATTYIIDYKDEDEHLSKLKEIRKGKEATHSVLQKESFFGNLLSDKAINYYYEDFYNRFTNDYPDYFPNGKGPSIYELLSDNKHNIQGCNEVNKYYLRQSFKEAGDKFNVFDSDTLEVIVPYKNGQNIIVELCSERAKNDLGYARSLIRKAAGYTVSLYHYQVEKIKSNNGIKYFRDLGIYILNPEFYDKRIGAVIEAVEPDAYY